MSTIPPNDNDSEITLSYLEGVGDDWVNHHQSSSSLNSDNHQNVDVSGLESLEEVPQAVVANNQESPSLEEKTFTHSFWKEMDVSLEDMVSNIFSTSERPIAIIRDDKIEYLNPIAIKILEVINLKSVQDEPFLKYVVKDDWNLLAENIGAMMAEAQKLKVRIRSLNGKVYPTVLQAVYLSDNRHFSFILIGNRVRENAPTAKMSSLYDEVTALPNFYLFEDRVQMAVNNENYKDVRLARNMIAVAAISIDNIEVFKKLNMEEFALKKLASSLVLNLNKRYTIARGLKYPFWVLMDDVNSEQALDVELARIRSILDDGVQDNFTSHEVRSSIGVSIFPQPAHSGKKLIEQTISALQEAIEEGTPLVFFNKY